MFSDYKVQIEKQVILSKLGHLLVEWLSLQSDLQHIPTSQNSCSVTASLSDARVQFGHGVRTAPG